MSHPDDETPADETPADETPADETPADETPADDTPADDSSAADASAPVDDDDPATMAEAEVLAEEPAGITEPPADTSALALTRHEARQRARQLRDEQRRTERRRAWIIRGAIAAAAVLLLGAVAIAVVFSFTPVARGPLNMASDGIRIEADAVAVRTSSVLPERDPADIEPAPDGAVEIRMYVDYLCDDCATFQAENSEQLRRWLDSGAAVLDIHPIATLETTAGGSQYSVRAANAAACVAELAPDSFLDFHEALLAAAPAEEGGGLDDDGLAQLARSVGVDSGLGLSSCIDDRRFRSWVNAASERAVEEQIPGTDFVGIPAMPTILVNDKLFTASEGYSAEEFARLVQVAFGESFDQTATPTPTPTPEDG